MADDLVDDQTVTEEDDFDRLRRKSTLASAVYDDMSYEDESGGGSPLSNLTPLQVIILALLLILDVVALGALVMIFTGAI